MLRFTDSDRHKTRNAVMSQFVKQAFMSLQSIGPDERIPGRELREFENGMVHDHTKLISRTALQASGGACTECEDGHGYHDINGVWQRGKGPRTDRQILLS